MKYDFTSLMNRSGHDSIAVDQIPIPGAEVKEGFSRIPMWVADMNFPSLPTIQEAIHARVNEPHFGYFNLPDAYFDSIIRWQKERNGVEDLPREAIGYENGVLGCVASAATAFTSPGESILLHSPTYIGFTGVLENCGRNIVLSDLVQDENGVWRMDYADMDRKLKEHNIHFAIFCSPHNPTGRVWEREEIEKAMEIYKANECVVISDEIWSDLTLPGFKHIPGESILLHSPTYIGFTGVLENCGRNIVLSDLVQDENGVWRMDYADMDRKLKEHNIHFAIFCSPHNPTGRVWEREEIEKAMEIYKANECVVISDEIWSDLTLPGFKHIPTQSVSKDARERTIALYAPSKTFNLAGLVGSYHIIYNRMLRDRVEKASSLSHYNSPNVLSVHALIGAYRPEGYQWVDELREVLKSNADYAYNYILEHFKGVKLSKPEGTYMLYLDCEEWCKEHDTDMDTLLKAGVAVGVIWQDGRPFHRPYAIRLNLALPHVLVKEAFDRMDKYVFNAK